MVRDYDLEIDIKTIQEYMHNTVLITTLSSKKSNVGGWQSPVYWSWSDELKELQTFVEKQIPEYTLQSLWYNSTQRTINIKSTKRCVDGRRWKTNCSYQS